MIALKQLVLLLSPFPLHPSAGECKVTVFIPHTVLEVKVSLVVSFTAAIIIF